MADDQPQTLGLRELALGQHIAEPLLLSVIMARDQHEIVGGRAVEFIRTLPYVAGEALDRFDAQVISRLGAGRLARPTGECSEIARAA